MQYLVAGTGAVFLTFVFFLVLPVIQSIGKAPRPDLIVRELDTPNLPPPPPPIEEEPEEEEPEEEPPPELVEEVDPLSLSELELALGDGFGDGWGVADFEVDLNAVVGGGGGDVDALFSLADLDQKPRILYQPSPVQNAKTRKKAPGIVNVLFIVDERGRVESPIVQSSTDPVFERPTLAAVKQWKFEPGKRNGQPVRFRMRIPITFPKD